MPHQQKLNPFLAALHNIIGDGSVAVDGVVYMLDEAGDGCSVHHDGRHPLQEGLRVVVEQDLTLAAVGRAPSQPL